MICISYNQHELHPARLPVGSSRFPPSGTPDSVDSCRKPCREPPNPLGQRDREQCSRSIAPEQNHRVPLFLLPVLHGPRQHHPSSPFHFLGHPGGSWSLGSPTVVADLMQLPSLPQEKNQVLRRTSMPKLRPGRRRDGVLVPVEKNNYQGPPKVCWQDPASA